MQALVDHSWPGNVRELKNLVERMFVSRTGGHLTMRDLTRWTLTARELQCQGAAPSEAALLLSALEDTKWNKQKAADRLHWSRSTLYRKMAKYQLPLIMNKARSA